MLNGMADVSFWYYFREFTTSYGLSTSKDVGEIISHQEVISLMYTDGTLPSFGSDFPKTALQKLKEKNYFTNTTTPP